VTPWAGIDESRPYGPSGLTTAKWKRQIAPELVRIADLILSQTGVTIEGLIHHRVGQRPGYGGDEFPHVIEHGGRLYLEDGHHRVALAILRGRKFIEARVLRRP
jgi:hypothetical protein